MLLHQKAANNFQIPDCMTMFIDQHITFEAS